jgi:hypothetical protein
VKSLDKNKSEILDRIASLRPDSARRWGKMTCHQMVVHLSDSYLCGLGEKIASPQKPPIPQGIMKWGALYVPLKWPRGVPTRPEMEQGIGGTAPTEFNQDRETLIALVTRFASANPQSNHPIFGRMTEKDWLRWGYLHSDHHLRQFGV